MELKIKKVPNEEVVVNAALNQFKGKNLFPEKSAKFNQMVERVGEKELMKAANTAKEKV